MHAHLSPCQEGEIKDWGRGGKQGWEAAVAGTDYNNQWLGLRFPSLRTLSDVERDGKTALWQGFGSWSSCQHCGLCKPSGWVMSQLCVQIPGQRRETRGCWLADAPGCGYRPSCKERGEVVLVAVIKRRGSRENCREWSKPCRRLSVHEWCPAGRQGEVGKGLENDRPTALQERARPAVSQGAVHRKDAHMP